ncbi:hypothetical protein BHU72_05175 [Desulfuribacillus stibiiarsenatis]|uniref:Transporter n=1 Tax=Desulfuribacillus stibiiarsenatis TaxID=1390249 RepID=A0A1E5L665_9FIRM|nr:TolC family protein [Desulfuribacillus stibiiarsenatis]OEH85479.1 hypothetical protein BHU72_05175 [Desulfuribacillus stibiiarsenatis]
MKKYILMLIILFIIPSISFVNAEALEKGKQETAYLTIEDAVNLGIKNSITLKNMEVEVAKLYEQRKRADEIIQFFTIDAENSAGYFSTGGDAGHAVITGSIQSLVAIDRQWKIAVKRYDMEKETIEYKVLQAYQDVLRAMKDIDYINKNIERVQYDLRLVDIKNQYGMASNFEYEKAKYAVSAAKDSLQTKKALLNSKVIELAKLIGTIDVESIELTDLPQKEIVNLDLDLHISRLRSDSPLVWIGEQQAYLAQLAVDNYTFNQNTFDTYQVKKLEVEIAQNRVNITKDQMESTAKNLFAKLKEIEFSYQELITSEKSLNNMYKNAEVRMNIGMSTKLELLQLQEQILSIQVQKYNLIAQQNILNYALKKPWVMGG